jgi:hypothetical protein
LTPESIAQAVTAVLAPLITLIGLASRRRRLRNDIRENLALLQEIDKDEILRDHSPASGWLKGKVVLDVAKLAGQPLGTPKKPIPKGSMAFAGVLAIGFSYLTYYIVRNGFVWYSVFPGIVAFLLFVSIFGMFTERDVPPDASGTLPPGAVPVRSDTASEQIASTVAFAASGQVDDRYGDTGQIGVVYKFLAAMHGGQFEEGLTHADRNWQLCMLQSWLWDVRNDLSVDSAGLQDVAESLLDRQDPTEVWQAFVMNQARSFSAILAPLDLEKLGAASRRRRIARDYDLVILAPVADTDGYFVSAATALPDAMTFVVHHIDGRWLVAHHAGTAPPQPGWPPAWWAINDPTIEALSEDG